MRDADRRVGEVMAKTGPTLRSDFHGASHKGLSGAGGLALALSVQTQRIRPSQLFVNDAVR